MSRSKRCSATKCSATKIMYIALPLILLLSIAIFYNSCEQSSFDKLQSKSEDESNGNDNGTIPITQSVVIRSENGPSLISGAAVDILFIINTNVSTSHINYHNKVRPFIDEITNSASGIDWRAAIAILGSAPSGDNELIERADGALVRKFSREEREDQYNLKREIDLIHLIGNRTNRPTTRLGIIQHMRNIFEKNHDFFRPRTPLFIVLISATDNVVRERLEDVISLYLKLPGANYNRPTPVYFNAIVNLKGPAPDSCFDEGYTDREVSPIGNKGTAFMEISDFTGGSKIDICSNQYVVGLQESFNFIQPMNLQGNDLSSIRLKCPPHQASSSGEEDREEGDEESGSNREVDIQYRANSSGALTPFTQTYTRNGLQLNFEENLPPGEYKLHYFCLNENSQVHLD